MLNLATNKINTLINLKLRTNCLFPILIVNTHAKNNLEAKLLFNFL